MVKEIFELNLLNAQYPFLPGQVIQGVVKVCSSEDIVTDGIFVTLEGKVIVGLPDHSPELILHNGRLVQKKINGAKYGRNIETLSSYSILPVIKPKEAEDRVQIPKGIHMYPFDYQLPFSRIPSSFSGGSGRIKYFIKAHMRLIDEEREEDAEETSPTSVYEKMGNIELEKYLDLNEKFDSIVPFTLERETYSCCCSGSGIKLKLIIPHQGYALGDKIPFEVTIVNKSSSILDRIKLRLVETWMFKGENGQTQWNETVGEVFCPPVHPKTTYVWTDTNSDFKVPHDSQVTHFGGGCTIIDVTHNIQILVELLCTFVRNIDEFIPILVGTVPLQRNEEDHLPFEHYVPPPVTKKIIKPVKKPKGLFKGKFFRSNKL